MEINPAEFASATMTAAVTARLDSLSVLLEYHEATRTEGANAYWGAEEDKVSEL